jgi:hypothetical protein
LEALVAGRQSGTVNKGGAEFSNVHCKKLFVVFLFFAVGGRQAHFSGFAFWGYEEGLL